VCSAYHNQPTSPGVAPPTLGTSGDAGQHSAMDAPGIQAEVVAGLMSAAVAILGFIVRRRDQATNARRQRSANKRLTRLRADLDRLGAGHAEQLRAAAETRLTLVRLACDALAQTDQHVHQLHLWATRATFRDSARGTLSSATRREAMTELDRLVSLPMPAMLPPELESLAAGVARAATMLSMALLLCSEANNDDEGERAKLQRFVEKHFKQMVDARKTWALEARAWKRDQWNELGLLTRPTVAENAELSPSGEPSE